MTANAHHRECERVWWIEPHNGPNEEYMREFVNNEGSSEDDDPFRGDMKFGGKGTFVLRRGSEDKEAPPQSPVRLPDEKTATVNKILVKVPEGKNKQVALTDTIRASV